MISVLTKLEQYGCLFQQLHRLLETGLSLTQAFELVIQDEKGDMKKKCQQFLDDLHKGDGFIDILSRFLPSFIPLQLSDNQKEPDISLLFKQLGLYFSTKHNAIKKSLQHMLYPLFLLGCMLMGLGLMITFLIPQLLSFFETNNMTYPLILQLFINFKSTLTRMNDGLLLGLGTLGVFALTLMARMLKTYLTPFFFPQNQSDIFWMLGLSLDSGMSLLTAIECIDLVSSSPYKKTWERLKQDTQKSGEFSLHLEKTSLLSNIHVQQLKYAEKTQRLGTCLLDIARQQQELEYHTLNKRLQYIQPISFCFLGGLIFLFIYILFIPLTKSLENLI